ncbi:MAG: FG-GAP repeat protein, partial [Planctomycetaceae bacterium]|nr:FG-GAP repeat protein [Planctomycetaceae bacterium]
METRCLLTAELVSVTPAPGPFEAGNDYSTNPDVNGDGRYVAFQSHADNLVDGVADTNGTQDVFVRDLFTGETILISINSDGTDSGRSEGISETGASITSGSFYPAISDSGRFVAFVSHAKDLVKGVTIDVTPNVYVRDRDADMDGIFDETGPGEATTMLLSRGMDGTAAGVIAGSGNSTRPVISGDGSSVVFGSFAPDMDIAGGATDINGSGGDVFLADTGTGKISLVTVAGSGTTSGVSSGGSVSDFSISTTGGVVTFGTTHADLVSAATGSVDDTNSAPDIFFGGGVGPVGLVSINAAGTGSGDDGSREPAVSGNGRHIAFISSATDLTGATDTNGFEDLFVRDLKTGVTTLVSRSRATGGTLMTGDGSTPGGSFLTDTEIIGGPALSESGRFVVFKSAAEDLLDPALGVVDGNGVADIFVFDRDPDGDGRYDEPGETETILVSVNAAGTASTGHTVALGSSYAPSISANGRYVAFASTGTDLVPGVTGVNVFIRDLLTGVTSVVSESSAGGSGGPEGTTPPTRLVDISDGGTVVAFQSDTDAALLDPGVTDPPGGAPVTFGEMDVFVGSPDGDIRTRRNFAGGMDEHRQGFRIEFEDVAPFDISYYLSSDATFEPATDTLLGTLPIMDPDDLMAGSGSVLTTAIGTGTGEIAFPGVGSADTLEDYFILAVLDPTDAVPEFDADPLNEDNTDPLRGVYHLGSDPVFVHGDELGQTITVTAAGGTVSVEYGITAFGTSRTFSYDAADVPEVRIRTHGGDDTVTGSDLGDVAFGGDGNDRLLGLLGPDSLFGGPGKDYIDGGDGDDILDGGPGPDVIFGGPGFDTIYDGPGDDVIDVGPDGGVIIATPGSDDIFIGSGGLDTLDFSFAEHAIEIDLDSTAVQTVDEELNTIQLIDEWENFVGSPLGGTVTLRPLPGTPRDARGGIGTDTLIVDAGSNPVINDGTKFSFPGTGLGDIVYGGFENIRVLHSEVQIVDDADDGFSGSGFFDSNPAFPQGFGGGLKFSNADSGNTATWTFSDLPQGTYAVSATWTSAPDRASNAPYTVYDGTPLDPVLSHLLVNQELPPGEFAEGGVPWDNLDIVTVTGNTLTVQITDVGANGFVAADAVRIEPILRSGGDIPLIANDTPNLPASGVGAPTTIREATGPDATSLLGTIAAFQSDLGGANNGDSAPQSSGFRSINWDDIADVNATPNLLPLDHFNSTFPRGAHLLTDGDGFQVSGSAASTDGARFENLNNTYPTAFGTFSAERLFTPVSSNILDIKFFVPGTDTPAAVSGFGAVFTDVDTQFTSQIQFFDAAGEQIGQRFALSSPGDASQSFLGLTFDNPVIAHVRITAGEGALPASGSPADISQGGADDLVVLDDFIYGEPVALPTPTPTDGFDSGGGSAVSGSGFLSGKHALTGDQTATWSFSNIPNGVYTVSATWTPTGSQASDALFTINNNGARTPVMVDQTMPPNGFTSAGIPWQPLTRIEVVDGNVVLTLNSPSGLPVIADAVTLNAASRLTVFDAALQSIQDGGTLNLGDIAFDPGTGRATGSHEVTIVNSGSISLQVDAINITGNGFTVDPLSLPISLPPLASAPVSFQFEHFTVSPFDTVNMNIDVSDEFGSDVFIFDIAGNIVSDSVSPTVQIVNPPDGAEFVEGTRISVEVTSSDDLGIRAVDLLVDGSVTATDVMFPFVLDLPRGANSTQIVARATDNAGNQTDSDPIVIGLLPDQPPTVTVVSPRSGEGFVEGTTIPVVIDAADDTGIERIEFLINGSVVVTEGPETFLTDIRVPAAGETVLRVDAYDLRGQVTSQSLVIPVFSLPALRSTSITASSESGSGVNVFDPLGNLSFQLSPYASGAGPIRVATGDVNGDGTPDVITGGETSGRPHVKVFDGTSGETIRSFFAFPPEFLGGVFVASGDVNGDDLADIIVGPDDGQPPNVRVFSGADGSLISSFFAFEPTFTGGVRVSAGDVTGDGLADIITGAGPGGGPRVRIFDGAVPQTGEAAGVDIGGDIGSFFAFEPSFVGGVFVGADDLNRDSRADIIIGSGIGLIPQVRVISGADGRELLSFSPYDVSDTG